MGAREWRTLRRNSQRVYKVSSGLTPSRPIRRASFSLRVRRGMDLESMTWWKSVLTLYRGLVILGARKLETKKSRDTSCNRTDTAPSPWRLNSPFDAPSTFPMPFSTLDVDFFLNLPSDSADTESLRNLDTPARRIVKGNRLNLDGADIDGIWDNLMKEAPQIVPLWSAVMRTCGLFLKRKNPLMESAEIATTRMRRRIPTIARLATSVGSAQCWRRPFPRMLIDRIICIPAAFASPGWCNEAQLHPWNPTSITCNLFWVVQFLTNRGLLVPLEHGRRHAYMKCGDKIGLRAASSTLSSFSHKSYR